MLFKQSSFLGLRLALFIGLSIILMVFDQRYDQLKHVRGGLSIVVAPIQYLIDGPVEVIDWVKDSFTRRQTLIEDNANLRAQMLLLNGKMHKILSLQKENEQLRALLQSASPIADQFTIANLLAISTDPYKSELVLNKGKKDNVYVGQPVLDANGVMGQIVQVGPRTSRLMLITDTRSAVPVQISRNGLRAIVVGTGVNRQLSLVDIADISEIKVGDVLTTSGLGLRYPEGYPVGTVNKVYHETGQHFATVYLTPSAHLNQSRQVLLVWQESKLLYDEAREQVENNE